MNNEQSGVDGTISQTGSTSNPIQVENVQYNVPVAKYHSKPSLVFMIANACLSVSLFMVASILFGISGQLFGFPSDNFGRNLQLEISVLIPAAIVGYIAIMRLRKLVHEQPAVLEDINFKSKLRSSFLFFLVLACLGSVIAIFNFIGIFIEINDTTVQNNFLSLYYVGGLIIMTLWLYSYQIKTKR